MVWYVICSLHLQVVEAGVVAELLAQAQHQLHHPPVGLYVRLEHLGGLYHTIPYHNIPYHTM